MSKMERDGGTMEAMVKTKYGKIVRKKENKY